METINSNTENTKDSMKPTENINPMDALGLYNGRSLRQAQNAMQDVKNLIQYIGDDPNREGLQETPKRVILSYDHLFSGYGQRVEDVLKVFEDDTTGNTDCKNSSSKDVLTNANSSQINTLTDPSSS